MSGDREQKPLATAELDLSQPTPVAPFRKLLRGWETLAAGMGVGTLSLPVVQGILTDPIVSITSRTSLAALGGFLFLKADRAISERVGNAHFMDLMAAKAYPEAALRAVQSVARTTAFWGFLPTLVAMWSDHLDQEEIRRVFSGLNTAAIEDAEHPENVAAFLEIQKGFQEDIIRGLSSEGDWTPEALAKLTLYYDGETLDENVLKGPDEALKTWKFEHNNVQWSITAFNADSWYVSDGVTSWQISPSYGESKIDLSLLPDKFPKSPEVKRYTKALRESGLIDGKAAIVDFVRLRTYQPQVVPADEIEAAVGQMSPFLPMETNHKLAVLLLDHAKSIESTTHSDWDGIALSARERHLGVGALTEPHSYASVLSTLSNHH